MPRVVAVSDLHGQLPPVSSIPEGDLLVIAGDVCPVDNHAISYQRKWLNSVFASWLDDLPYPAERILWIAGNHDFALELGGPSKKVRGCATYLQDSSVEVEGLLVYGSPWSKVIGPWAFSLPEHAKPDPRFFASRWREQIAPGAGAAPPAELGLERVWSKIPDTTDIVLVHSPPYAFGDRVVEGEHVGSPSLARRLREIGPKLVVCGHIHEAHGRWSTRWQGRPGRIINASLLNERYEAVFAPEVVDL